MKKHQFFLVPIIGILIFVGCQENTPDPVANETDAATAEKMVRDFNVRFTQNFDQVLEQSTSDNFVFINGEGAFVSKTQMFDLAKSFKVAKWDLNDLNVRVFGNVFVATGVNNHTIVRKEDSTAIDYQTAFTYIYEEQGGKLRVVSQQHSHVQNSEDSE